MPIKIESESNVRDHWRTRSKRVKSHRQIAFAMLRRFDPPTGQVLVCLARVRPTAGRDLDAHDNLRTGFKATVDGICDWLGIRDDDPRVRFEYAQRVGKAYDVDVTIEADK